MAPACILQVAAAQPSYGWCLGLNYVLVPLIVAALITVTGIGTSAVGLDVCLVLLAPCVDYVVVFTRFAGGDYRTLLACTPLLLIAQTAIIPLWTSIYVYIGILESVEGGGFGEHPTREPELLTGTADTPNTGLPYTACRYRYINNHTLQPAKTHPPLHTLGRNRNDSAHDTVTAAHVRRL